MVSQWTGFYDKVVLSNGGMIITEESKATCPIGGPECITIIDHGQIAGVSSQNMSNADEEVLAELNPAINMLDDEGIDFPFFIK